MGSVENLRTIDFFCVLYKNEKFLLIIIEIIEYDYNFFHCFDNNAVLKIT